MTEQSPRVLVARCDNYREDVDQACHGEIRFRWGMSQSGPCDTCGARCGIAVAAWERVELAGAVPDTGQARRDTRADVVQRLWSAADLAKAVGLDELAGALTIAFAELNALAAHATPDGLWGVLANPSPPQHNHDAKGVYGGCPACGTVFAEPSGDTVQSPDVADLAYARSEVDKWLASNDPYCILPTRTEHIPALLARLDELEGTR